MMLLQALVLLPLAAGSIPPSSYYKQRQDVGPSVGCVGTGSKEVAAADNVDACYAACKASENNCRVFSFGTSCVISDRSEEVHAWGYDCEVGVSAVGTKAYRI